MMTMEMQQSVIVEDYNKHMGYVDKRDRMQTVIQQNVGHGNGLENYSFTYCTR